MSSGKVQGFLDFVTFVWKSVIVDQPYHRNRFNIAVNSETVQRSEILIFLSPSSLVFVSLNSIHEIDGEKRLEIEIEIHAEEKNNFIFFKILIWLFTFDQNMVMAVWQRIYTKLVLTTYNNNNINNNKLERWWWIIVTYLPADRSTTTCTTTTFEFLWSPFVPESKMISSPEKLSPKWAGPRQRRRRLILNNFLKTISPSWHLAEIRISPCRD